MVVDVEEEEESLLLFIFNLFKFAVTNEVGLDEDEFDDIDDIVLEVDEERDVVVDEDRDDVVDDKERVSVVEFERLNLQIKEYKTKIFIHLLLEITYKNKLVLIALSLLVSIFLTNCERER